MTFQNLLPKNLGGTEFAQTSVQFPLVSQTGSYQSFPVDRCSPTRALMFRKFLRSKIHRATVTQADLEYEGSLTIPPQLLRAAQIEPYEAVSVWNVTSGTRLETYAIVGEPDSNDICANGAAAHLIKPGDVVIIATFMYSADEKEMPSREPRVVFVDAENRMTGTDHEIPGPKRRATAVSHKIDSYVSESD